MLRPIIQAFLLPLVEQIGCLNHSSLTQCKIQKVKGAMNE